MPFYRSEKGKPANQFSLSSRKKSRAPQLNRRNGKSWNDSDEGDPPSSCEDEEGGDSIHAEVHVTNLIDDGDKDDHSARRSWHKLTTDGESPKVLDDGRPSKRIKLVYRRAKLPSDHVTQPGGASESNPVTNPDGGSSNKTQPALSTMELDDLQQKIETLEMQKTHHAEVSERLRSKLAELTCKLQDIFWKHRTDREVWNRELRLLKMEKKLLWDCGIEWSRREQLWSIERRCLVARVHQLSSNVVRMTKTPAERDSMGTSTRDADPNVNSSLNQDHL